MGYPQVQLKEINVTKCISHAHSSIDKTYTDNDTLSTPKYELSFDVQKAVV